MKFNIIIGNPPYQNDKTCGNYVLWSEFIKQSSRLLMDGGTLSMVVPQSWAANKKTPTDRARSVATIRRDVFSKGYLEYANFNISDHFPKINSTFSYFIWHYTKIIKDTLVETINGTYNTDYDSVLWLKIKLTTIEPIENPSLRLIDAGKETTGYRSGDKGMGFGKFKIANTSAQYSKGIFLTSSIQHPYQYTQKVIFSLSGYPNPFYDCGKLGLGHHARAFAVESIEDAKSIIDFLNSDYILDLASTIPDSGTTSSISKLMSVGYFDK